MANRHIVAYIRNGLSQGYDVQVLRNHLISQGYAQTEVDAAIADLYHGGADKGKFFLILGVLFIILLFGGGIGAFMYMNQAPAASGVPSLVPQTQVSNQVQTQGSQESPVQSTPVQQERQAEEEAPRSQSSSEPAPQTQVSPVTSFAAQEEESIRELLRNIRSVTDCENLEEQRDKCVLEYAWKEDHVNFCERIDGQTPKDQCYSRHALRHEDRTTCQSITNPYSRETCDILLRTAEMLRSQGTIFELDAKNAKINYNPQQAVADLRKNAEEQAQARARAQSARTNPTPSAATTSTTTTPAANTTQPSTGVGEAAPTTNTTQETEVPQESGIEDAPEEETPPQETSGGIAESGEEEAEEGPSISES